MKQVFHALVLNLHQPAGNLEELLEQNQWEAREILFALDRETSRALHDLQRRAAGQAAPAPEGQHRLEQARWHLLRAETSCHFFWGEAWLPRCHRDLDAAWHWLNLVEPLRPDRGIALTTKNTKQQPLRCWQRLQVAG